MIVTKREVSVAGERRLNRHRDPERLIPTAVAAATVLAPEVVGLYGAAKTGLDTGQAIYGHSFSGEPLTDDERAEKVKSAVIGGVAIGFGAALSSRPAAPDVWRLGPFERGVAIENALGRNLPDNFPVIDRFARGVATSIKSLDLEAKSYQSITSLTRAVKKYVDKVAAFNGKTWGTVKVKSSEITGRALELVVPAGGGTAAQQAALRAAVQYGRTVGVNVTIIPW